MIMQTDVTDEKKAGYPCPKTDIPTKRYYQTLDLKDDPELIGEYKKRHRPPHYWSEVAEGIRSVGILDMEIFLFGTRLVMVVETAMDFEWDEAFARLAEMPVQARWEEYMSIFQQAEASASSAEKWQLMEKIFSLP